MHKSMVHFDYKLRESIAKHEESSQEKSHTVRLRFVVMYQLHMDNTHIRMYAHSSYAISCSNLAGIRCKPGSSSLCLSESKTFMMGQIK